MRTKINCFVAYLLCLVVLEAVFFGVVAIVLLFKLHSILGRSDEGARTQDLNSPGGFNGSHGSRSKRKSVIDITFEVEANKKVSATPPSNSNDSVNDVHYIHVPVFTQKIDPDAESGFASVVTPFCKTVDEFIGIAGEIYQRFLLAYNNADMEPVGNYVSAKIKADITDALLAKKSCGLVDRVVLVKITSVLILSAKFVSGMPEVDVLFSSQQLHYLENEVNEVGEVVSGSKSSPVTVNEVWTFVGKPSITKRQDKTDTIDVQWALVSITDTDKHGKNKNSAG